MSAPSQDTAVRTSAFMRAAIYALLILFAVYFLLPLYVMLVNSVKPLTEIQQGRMLALPLEFTIIRCIAFMLQPRSMNSAASQSSSSGCEGGSPCEPKSSDVLTRPVPNNICQ